MDRWKRAHRYFGFSDLDHKWERFIVYGTAAVFWVNLAAWLVARDGIIPSVDGLLEWLLLALLATPGTVRAAFLIALGPNRQGQWERSWVNPDPEGTRAPLPVPAEMIDTGEVPDPGETPPGRKWWRVRAKLRSEFTRKRRPRRQARNARPLTATWSGPEAAAQATQPPLPPAVPVQPQPRQGGSTAKTLVKILAVLTLFAVCGGYWLTGGNIVSPSDTTTEPPRLRNVAEKRHMLELINEARSSAGIPPVTMGTNNVAQIQADQLLEDCISSHWGTDGLKPYMRYSLAGGYQVNGENFSGHNECGLADTLLNWNADPMEMVADSVEGLLDSPGHRETMLSPEYWKVNLGLAWDRNVFKVVQHFEGDYVEMDALPVIVDEALEVAGRLNVGHEFTGRFPMLALINYDPAPKRLNAGQLARTYCYGHGEGIRAFIPPSRLLRDDFEITHSLVEAECVDPYKLSRSVAEPESQEESLRMFQESKDRSELVRETELTLSVRKARELTVNGREFYLKADMTELLDEYGPGVYTVVLIAELEEKSRGEPDTVISEYSIFHEVRAPRTYGQGW